MEINEIQDTIIEEFLQFKTMSETYKHLIGLAKSSKPLDQKYKIDENTIKGCQSSVWVKIEYLDGKLHINADAEVLITKGIISLILRVFDNQKPFDIINSDLYFFDKVGLKQSLSPQRANGVKAVIEYIQKFAKHFI